MGEFEGEERSASTSGRAGAGRFYGSFGVFFSVLFLLFFRVAFLIVFGSFWGAFWGCFWKQKSIKMRTCDFLIFIDFP